MNDVIVAVAPLIENAADNLCAVPQTCFGEARDLRVVHDASIEGFEHANIHRTVIDNEKHMAFHVLEFLGGYGNALGAKIPVPSVRDTRCSDTDPFVM